MLCQIYGFTIECARRVGLLHRNVAAANPGVIHPNVGDYVPPSSATAIFIGCPISFALFSAALITRRASSSFTADIDTSLQLFQHVVRRPEVRELVQQI